MTPTGAGVLQIEPTDRCNLACAMCAPHAEGWETIHGVPKGQLSWEVYTQILDRLVDDGVSFDHIIFQWLGDPSLHPRLEDMLALAGARLRGRVGYLRVDTNALALGPARLARLAAAAQPGVPLLVVFTLDAATPETYARVKGRPGLERARRHVRHLLALRRQLPPDRALHVQVQFVVQEGNAGEARAFYDYWYRAWACHHAPEKARGAGGHFEILFKRLSVSGGAAGQAAADALYERALAEAGITAREEPGLSVQVWERRPWQADDAHATRGPCPGLWLTPVIRHDGQLQVCCADLGSTLALGPVHTHGFRALWEGEAATRLRLAHLEGRFEGACKACGGINWYDLPSTALADARARAKALGL